ncbi:hypothetical protein [Tropicimonas marinistellae]|uniref:hypothetical protein n=1 Tax=Tropicimonas marinistellae TaxID=1739787 RepID=UPI0008357132|nr:hypothetical protein [Tropicimonas marinistellae]
MLDRGHSLPRLVAVGAPSLPVAELLVGRRIEEATELLPRLFNLCRAAQEGALRLALGIETAATEEALAQELRREHVAKLFVVWPRHFGQPGVALPEDWKVDSERLLEAMFGPAASAPKTAEEVTGFLASDLGTAPLLRRISECFPIGSATCRPLPAPTPDLLWSGEAIENSTAARHLGAPAMLAIEASHGRGPLWRAWARLEDLRAVLSGRLPRPDRPRRTYAIIPAARGSFAVQARAEDGRLTFFRRVTPTDHLLVPGGILEQCLATLPVDRQALSPLLLDILDPCSPLRLKEVRDA